MRMSGDEGVWGHCSLRPLVPRCDWRRSEQEELGTDDTSSTRDTTAAATARATPPQHSHTHTHWRTHSTPLLLHARNTPIIHRRCCSYSKERDFAPSPLPCSSRSRHSHMQLHTTLKGRIGFLPLLLLSLLSTVLLTPSAVQGSSDTERRRERETLHCARSNLLAFRCLRSEIFRSSALAAAHSLNSLLPSVVSVLCCLLLLLLLSSAGDDSTISDQIYTSYINQGYCVRLTTQDSWVGCGLPADGTTGRIRLAQDMEQIKALVADPPSYDVALLMDQSLFSRTNVRLLAGALQLAGIMLLPTDSSATSGPNPPAGGSLLLPPLRKSSLTSLLPPRSPSPRTAARCSTTPTRGIPWATAWCRSDSNSPS